MMLAVLIIALLMGVAHGQENAGTLVATGLRHCYQNGSTIDKDDLPPSSINVAIDLIRKTESGLSKQDARQYSTEILHRFRQDGIIKRKDVDPSLVLPHKPLEFQMEKNILLLKHYIPGDAQNFPNETLTLDEQCALHYMMSNTVILDKRGDEGTTCNKIGRYIKRYRRAVDGTKNTTVSVDKKKLPADTEILTVSRTSWRFQGDRSTCPIENGVVYAKWGSVQLGTVIAGIATGLQPLGERIDTGNGTYVVDSRYASTLVGDIAEVAFVQGKKSNFNVGASGSWQSIIEPRNYYISENTGYAMTDAEIRAGTDGLILALKIEDWKKDYPLIKLSQILDMYYSDKGVFSSNYRACARKERILEIINSAPSEFKDQSIAFTYQYSKGELNADGAKTLIEKTIEDFKNYAYKMNDVGCKTSLPIQRIAADIVIFLDTTIEYPSATNTISALLDNVDLNKYGSNVTIYNGEDCRQIVPSTYSIVDYFEKYNKTVHIQHPRGFKYSNVYAKIEEIMKQKADEDKANNNVGGRSTVFVLLPSNTPSDQDNNYITERLNLFKKHLAEFNILVIGRSSQSAYNHIVFNSGNDIFQLTDGNVDTQVTNVISDVIKRFKDYPRKIQNPKCGSQWSNELSSNSLVQYIEANTTNYYSISYHNLAGEQSKNLKISFDSFGADITVCFQNKDCKQGNQEISYDLTSYCSGREPISDCPSFRFSVSANSTRNARCTDDLCRFPDNAKYTISVDGFGCTNASSTIFSSILLLAVTFLFSKLT